MAQLPEESTEAGDERRKKRDKGKGEGERKREKKIHDWLIAVTGLPLSSVNIPVGGSADQLGQNINALCSVLHYYCKLN